MASEVVHTNAPLWRRLLKWLLWLVLALLLLIGAVLLGINTDPGRRFVADRVGAYTTESGLTIKVGRIDGSLYGRMRLRDVRVSDPKGVFATAPELDVDWRPFAYVHKHIDVRDLSARLVTLLRNPALKAVVYPPGTPTLPDLDIDVNHLRVDRLVLEPPVSGARRIARIDGRAHIADRTARLKVDARTLVGPGIAGGDVAHVTIDAVPDDDKLAIDVKLTAPANGAVAALAGLRAPLAVTVGGRGSWTAWNGRLTSTLGGGALADLALSARAGSFTVRGVTHPGLYLAGPVERLTAPGLNVDLTAALQNRRIDTRFALRSDALAVAGNGLIDLATSRFSNLRINADLLTPGSIAPNLKGRGLHGELALNGAFRTPTVDYKLRADVVQFGTNGVEGLYAEGLATIDAHRILLPVNARARRVTGLNAAAGGLLTNVAINGDVAIQGTQVLSDNLRLRSDKIDATAIVAANLSTGRYTGALKGRINDYLVNGIGIINLTTDARLVTAPGGFGITGLVVAQTVKIINSGAKTFLGGNATVSTNFGYDPNGVIRFNDLHLVAPQFRVTRGRGEYRPNGQLIVVADAYSTQYGPLNARITGTATDPVIVLHAARPGVGVGLANVDARIVGRGGAYQVNARGGTKYGPFTADVLVRPGASLAVDIHKVVFAGINFAGRVVQTGAGPFAGRLTFVGSGLSGNVALAAQGKYQRADVAARAYRAVIPGVAGFTIGRAIVNASVVIFPTAPQVVADAQVADLRYGPTVVSAGRVKVNYVGGRGTAQALLTGSNGVPFRLAANAVLSPTLYTVALQGSANNIAFHTGALARITAAKGVYRLFPTPIVFDKGSARVAGSYGRGLSAQLRLDALDLSVANALIPNLGIGGQATGALDFAQASATAFPTATARMTVTGFSRTSLASASEPVDIVFAGDLASAGATARALVKRGPTTVGRLIATLSPIPGGGSWSERLLRAPLGGGIRYNGPAGVLFSLAALTNQQLAGPIAVAADFSGRVQVPVLNGQVRADNLTYDNETYGTRLTNLQIAAHFNMDQLRVDRLTARAGDGTVQAQGTIGLAAAQGFPVDLTAKFDNARLARSDSLAAVATGQLHITKDLRGGLIQGRLAIPNARYAIIRQGAAEVPELTGVRRKSDVNRAGATAQLAPAPAGLFKLDIAVAAENQLFVSGFGLESEWQMDLHVAGTSAAPQVAGRLQLLRGTYSFAGKRFDVTRGTVDFRGGALTDPDIDIEATTTTNGITAVIRITGTGTHPNIIFTSSPALPQDEVLSRLLFGTDPSNLSATEAIQLASALNSLRGTGAGGLNPLGKLRSATGFDRLRVLGADQATGRGTSLAAGKYITRNIYVEIITDARGYTATQLTIALTKSLSLLSQAGSFGGSNASLKYSRDY